MNRTGKEAEVKELQAQFDKAKAVIFADYKGVTSNEMNDLRASLRKLDAEFKVVKNNLVRVALKGTPKEAAVQKLVGPSAAFFSYNDPAAAAKALSEFAKTVEAFVVKDGFLGDQAISEAEIKALSDLPSKEVLLAQLLSVMNGPIRNFVSVLAAVPRDFVCVLQAIADKKKD